MDEPLRAIVSQMAHLVTGVEQEENTTGKNREYTKQAHYIASEMIQILSGLNDPVILVSKEGLPVLANTPAKTLLGLDPTGRPIKKVIEKLQLTATNGIPVTYDDLPIKYALGGQAIVGEHFSLLDKNSNTRFISVSSYPLVLNKTISGAVIVMRDESNAIRKTAPSELVRESSALKAIFDSAPEAIVVVDENCSIIMSNPKARWLYSLQHSDGSGWTGEEPVPRYSDDPPNDIIALPLGRTVFRGDVISNFEVGFAVPGKPVKHILINTSPIRNQDGLITGGVGIFHDITEKKVEKLALQRIRQQLEKRVAIRTRELSETVESLESEIQERAHVENKLRHSEATLKKISKKMLDTLEADRKTIAKELHDSIGASLAAIKFSLEEKLVRMTSAPPDDLVSLEKLVSHLMDTIKETKRISANLRPTTMDDLGLSATIAWFCREFKLFYKHIDITQDIDIDESEVSESMKIVIYRILQEATTNAAKHGNPSNIYFSLKKNHQDILLTISDNGLGFEIETGLISTDPLSGHGLAGMKERAEICGGVFKIDSKPGEGTRIEVSLPMKVNKTC